MKKLERHRMTRYNNNQLLVPQQFFVLLVFWMGFVSVIVTTICRPPPIVHSFLLSSSPIPSSVVPSSLIVAVQQFPGAIGRTATGITAYATLSASSPSSESSSNKGFQGSTLSSIIGNMASSVFGRIQQQPSNNKPPTLDNQLESMNVPSWSAIRLLLEQQQSPTEKSFRTNIPYGYGVGSPLHKIRLYDETNKEEDIRVTFYRDSASWCPYCQKVWIALEEKKIPYRVEKINMRCYGEKPMSFQRLQPSGQIPVAIIDGTVYRQSNDILTLLDTAFPNHKSLAAPSLQQTHAQSLLRLERQLFSVWMYWLTSSDDRNGSMKQSFVNVLQQVENALQQSDGPFFLGDDISIVDIQFAPFLERMAASMLYFKGFQIRGAPGAPTNFPAINQWFDAMERLPSYQLTKSDYYTHCWDLPPQLGGCVMEPAGKQYAQIINGEKRIDDETKGSWELPLQPHNGGVEPDWLWEDEGKARREAVERLSFNYQAIINFAARGAGTKGFPSYSAPLADPNATPNEAVQTAVCIILRVICISILDASVDTHKATMNNLCKIIVNDGSIEFSQEVINSLSYLRDRVGVPRDMQLGAARQLRAHINWAIGMILDAKDSS